MNHPQQDPWSSSWVTALWNHAWGRVLLIALTIGAVSWALRETAVVTFPLLAAVTSVLVPLAIGFTIAYILAPLVDFVQRSGANRLLSSTAVFSVIFVVVGLLSALMIPAIITQGTDLVSRTVQDEWYIDRNGNQFAEDDEVRLRPHESIFYEDSNGNGIKDDGEISHTIDDPRLARQPSLLQFVAEWIDEKQGDFQQFIGQSEPQDRYRFVVFYQQHVMSWSQALDDLVTLQSLRGLGDEWDSRDPPVLVDSAWDGQWPGEYGAQWRQMDLSEDHRAWIRFYGALYYLRHQQLLSVWSADQLIMERARFAPPAVLAAVQQHPLVSPLQNQDLLTLFQEFQVEEGNEETSFIQTLQDQVATSFYARDLRHVLDGQVAAAADKALLRDALGGVDEEISGGLKSVSQKVGQWLRGAVTNVNAMLSLSLDAILIPIYAFFLTLAMPQIRAGVGRYIPAPGRKRTIRILHHIERVVAAFFRGRLIVCLLCALLVWIGFAIIAVPYAFLFAVCIGLATAVPLAGLLFLIPAILLTMVEGGGDLGLRIGLLIGIYAIVQTLEMTVFTPTIMGREVELHPVTLIVALLFCGQVLGVLGLILAVPIAATVRILAREFVLPKLREFAHLPPESRLWTKSMVGSHAARREVDGEQSGEQG